jgi:putative transcriptional regulator
MLTVYKKNAQENLTPIQLRLLGYCVRWLRSGFMNNQDFANLVESIRQTGEIKRAQREPSRKFEFTPLDIKAIRQQLNKSQSEFALMIGVSVTTLQNWEQGRRPPEGPARALLMVAAKNPQAIQVALGT